jgi:hypothetical protein
VLVAGSIVLRRSRLSFYREGLQKEAARKEASGVSEELKRLRQETANAKARADKAVENAKIAKNNAVLAANKRATTQQEINRLQEMRKAARDAEAAANVSIAEAQKAVERQNASTAQLLELSPNPAPPLAAPAAEAATAPKQLPPVPPKPADIARRDNLIKNRNLERLEQEQQERVAEAQRGRDAVAKALEQQEFERLQNDYGMTRGRYGRRY